MAITTNARGLLRPFRRNQTADLASGTGADLLESKVGQILGNDGEMPWRPEAVSGLERLRHHNNGPVLVEVARVFVIDALAVGLPSVRVISVEATREPTRIAVLVTFYDINDDSRTERTSKAFVRIR